MTPVEAMKIIEDIVQSTIECDGTCRFPKVWPEARDVMNKAILKTFNKDIETFILQDLSAECTIKDAVIFPRAATEEELIALTKPSMTDDELRRTAVSTYFAIVDEKQAYLGIPTNNEQEAEHMRCVQARIAIILEALKKVLKGVKP